MEIERSEELALMRMQGGKANAMTPQFLQALSEMFERVAESDARAVVLAGYEKYFSAGLALPSLVGLDRPAMTSFMELFGATMLRIFSFDRPVVAAINGHAIAGGCVLALMCDVRVIAEGATKIGLNEVQLGIGLPSVVIEPLRLQLPARSMLPIALEGNLLTPHEALECGLVDDVAPADQLEARAIAKARSLARAPRAGVAQVKAALRRPAIEAIRARGAQERELWLDTWYSKEAQAVIQRTVEKLSAPKSRT